MHNTVSAVLALVFVAIAPAATAAESYPARPIRLIVPFPAGGATDVLARIYAQKLAARVGRNVIIDNRTGASGNVGSEIAARAAPDGYTLVMGNVSSHAINASLFKLPYDPVRDFAPISVAAVVTNVLVVHPSVPAKSVKELIAAARAAPGKTGKLRALAVTSATRSRAAPEVPTIAESGLAGYEVTAWNGVLAPARTPKAIIDRLYNETVAILREPDVAERYASLGAEPLGNTPQQFAAMIAADVKKWGEVARAAKLKID